MKKILSILLILTMLSVGCQKSVTIPSPQSPPDISMAVQKIVESNLTPEAKAVALKQLADSHQLDLNYLQKVYEEQLKRAETAGGNLKEVVLQIIGIAASCAAIILAANK